MLFPPDIALEVEQRLQKLCDDRVREGLPAPISLDACRVSIRREIDREINERQDEARRRRQEARAAEAKPKPTPAARSDAASTRAPTPPTACLYSYFPQESFADGLRRAYAARELASRQMALRYPSDADGRQAAQAILDAVKLTRRA